MRPARVTPERVDAQIARTRAELIVEGRREFDAMKGERPIRSMREDFARAYADIAGFPHTGRFVPKADPVHAAVTDIHRIAGGSPSPTHLTAGGLNG